MSEIIYAKEHAEFITITCPLALVGVVSGGREAHQLILSGVS
jgi:hypothetical protein